LDQHIQAVPQCSFQKTVQVDPLEGITSKMESRLSSRKGSKAASEKERWAEVWKIIFPDDTDEDILSPGMFGIVTLVVLDVKKVARNSWFDRLSYGY
jgi:hypothetical protein